MKGLAMTPDFSSLWVMMFVLGAIAAAYATVIAMFVIAAPTSDLIFGLGELRRSKGSLPLVWSSAIAGLTAALAYACGHVSVRWRKRVLRKKRQKDV